MIEPYERKTNYYDTDQMAIIHHSNYVRYLEEARLYYMEQFGLPYRYVEEQGILIPVLGVSVEYKKSIVYGDTIVIQQWIDSFSPVKFSMCYEIRNKETGELHATATSKHCFVDKNLSPIRLRKEYPQIYEKFKSAAEQDREALKKKRTIKEQ